MFSEACDARKNTNFTSTQSNISSDEEFSESEEEKFDFENHEDCVDNSDSASEDVIENLDDENDDLFSEEVSNMRVRRRIPTEEIGIMPTSLYSLVDTSKDFGEDMEFETLSDNEVIV